MLKILFNDGLIFKTFENGKIREYGCDFYNNYIDSARRAAKNSEWKTQGSGARFMGVYEESDINRAPLPTCCRSSRRSRAASSPTTACC